MTEDKRLLAPSEDNIRDIRDEIADLINRVGFLENSLPFPTQEGETQTKIFMPVLPKLIYYKPKHLNWKNVTIYSKINDLEGEMGLLKRDLTEHKSISKRKYPKKLKGDIEI